MNNRDNQVMLESYGALDVKVTDNKIQIIQSARNNVLHEISPCGQIDKESQKVEGDIISINVHDARFGTLESKRYDINTGELINDSNVEPALTPDQLKMAMTTYVDIDVFVRALTHEDGVKHLNVHKKIEEEFQHIYEMSLIETRKKFPGSNVALISELYNRIKDAKSRLDYGKEMLLNKVAIKLRKLIDTTGYAFI